MEREEKIIECVRKCQALYDTTDQIYRKNKLKEKIRAIITKELDSNGRFKIF